jgi:protein-disulfide isomerase
MPLRPPVSENDHMQGSSAARIELVEYGDYQCPYCGAAYPIIKNIQAQLGGDLKFIFRNFPLDKIHPQATMAAVASEAAALQGKYWEMHDLLFENQKKLNYSSLLKYATQLDLDIARFEMDIAKPEYTEKVKDSFYSGMRSGVNATPTFFINNEKYIGQWDGDELLKYLQAILNDINPVPNNKT